MRRSATDASVWVSSRRMHVVDRVELLRPVQRQHNDAGVRPFDDQRLGHRTQRRGKPSTCWAMMLRWISEVPPAIVPPKLRA